MNKNDMTLRQTIPVDLPCRFVNVMLGLPPGDAHLRWGGRPQSCWMIYAIGATYTGDGTKVDQYKTEIYKIGVAL